jgi:two-component system sensor histidine kinase TctE
MPDERTPGHGAEAPMTLPARAIARAAALLGRHREPTTASATTPPLSIFDALRRTGEQRSLFGEILDWMLAPLLLLWPMSVTITYLVAQTIANVPYDQHLSENVQTLASFVRVRDERVVLATPLPVRDLLRVENDNGPQYMVLGMRGELIAGDGDLPLPNAEEQAGPGEIKLRFDSLHGADVRVAYTWVQFRDRPQTQASLVQVVEPLERREQLANEIIRGVIVPQFIVLPIAVVLVWFGLSRGLAPLNTLQATIRARRSDDLSPIDRTAAPEEMSPLVDAFNELMARFKQNMLGQKRFLADAAHQMKTPLAGLRTQAELALRETDPQQLRRSLRQIAGASERATHLINQLLSLARAEHQASSLGAYELVDLTPLVRELTRDWVPQALARRIDFGFEAPSRPARVIGVPVLLRELLNNLVDNALRYTPEEGMVTVRVRCDAQSVELDVEDTGPGIPVGERQLVFERFYRVLGTNVDGSGLGLAIVREIVQQHDALVSITNNPRAVDPASPGTLVSVVFRHVAAPPPTVATG